MADTVLALSDELELLVAELHKFSERDLVPGRRAAEQAARWPDGVLAHLDGFGLPALGLPERLGGVGGGTVAKVAALSAIAAHDAGGLPAADQPGRAAGALVACPDGTLADDLAKACLARETQVLLVGERRSGELPARVVWAPAWPPVGWVWATRGDELELLEVPHGAVTGPTTALAFHASGGVSLTLGDCTRAGRWRLPAGGGASVRAYGRLWLAAVALGVAEGALAYVVDYTTGRMVFGRPVAHHQGNAFALAEAATRLDAAKGLLHQAAAHRDEGSPHAPVLASFAWAEVRDAALFTTDLGVQLLGGHGFITDHPVEKWFREAKMLTLLGEGGYAATADAAEGILEWGDPLLDRAGGRS